MLHGILPETDETVNLMQLTQAFSEETIFRDFFFLLGSSCLRGLKGNVKIIKKMCINTHIRVSSPPFHSKTKKGFLSEIFSTFLILIKRSLFTAYYTAL